MQSFIYSKIESLATACTVLRFGNIIMALNNALYRPNSGRWTYPIPDANASRLRSWEGSRANKFSISSSSPYLSTNNHQMYSHRLQASSNLPNSAFDTTAMLALAQSGRFSYESSSSSSVSSNLGGGGGGR